MVVAFKVDSDNYSGWLMTVCVRSFLWMHDGYIFIWHLEGERQTEA